MDIVSIVHKCRDPPATLSLSSISALDYFSFPLLPLPQTLSGPLCGPAPGFHQGADPRLAAGEPKRVRWPQPGQALPVSDRGEQDQRYAKNNNNKSATPPPNPPVALFTPMPANPSPPLTPFLARSFLVRSTLCQQKRRRWCKGWSWITVARALKPDKPCPTCPDAFLPRRLIRWPIAG